MPDTEITRAETRARARPLLRHRPRLHARHGFTEFTVVQDAPERNPVLMVRETETRLDEFLAAEGTDPGLARIVRDHRDTAERALRARALESYSGA
jgi:hypothetical protein